MYLNKKKHIFNLNTCFCLDQENVVIVQNQTERCSKLSIYFQKCLFRSLSIVCKFFSITDSFLHYSYKYTLYSMCNVLVKMLVLYGLLSPVY